MLQGLCTRLGVAVPFMQPMAQHAKATLLAHAAQQLRALPVVASAAPAALLREPSAPLRPSPRVSLRASLHERVLHLLHALSDTGELLGGQVCVVHRGQTVVDAAAGRMGPVDPRPVQPSTCFQLFQAGAPCLAALVLQV